MYVLYIHTIYNIYSYNNIQYVYSITVCTVYSSEFNNMRGGGGWLKTDRWWADMINEYSSHCSTME